MKVVILAGGFGTRISEETTLIPKPMVEIGGKPILWHIMKIYSSYGYNDFVICLGYKGYVIKEYFSNYFLHQSDISIDLSKNQVSILNSNAEPWKITLIDTGQNSMTGGRIKRIKQYTEGKSFMLTYGDGVSDVDIPSLVKHHQTAGKLCSVTAVQPLGRFGALNLDEKNNVSSFQEKPRGDGSWINGGFFVCEQGVFDYISGDESIWEKEPLENLAKDGQLSAFKHDGFWMPMDTLRDKKELENIWQSGKNGWNIWDRKKS